MSTESKLSINVLVMGHIDSGKSTLIGQILNASGLISKQQLHRNKNDSIKMGKSSFYLAWSMDETEEERQRGITFDISTVNLETDHRNILFIDSPGHRDFLPKMLQGASQADAAILIVDGSFNRFEAALDEKSQTHEHLLLASTFGLNQLIVAVNKMDSTDWDESRFEDIIEKLKRTLKKYSFQESNVQFVPISALSNSNLVPSSSSDAGLPPWIQKYPPLLSCVDRLQPPIRNQDFPFRFSVSAVHKDQRSSDPVIAGVVVSGSVVTKSKKMLLPQNKLVEIKKIFQNGQFVDTALSGSHIEITLGGIKLESIKLGNMLCCEKSPACCSDTLVAKMNILDIKSPILPGTKAEFYNLQLETSVTFQILISSTSKESGHRTAPRFLTSGCAEVLLKFDDPIPFDLYKSNKMAGRFIIRRGGSTIGFGVITSLSL